MTTTTRRARFSILKAPSVRERAANVAARTHLADAFANEYATILGRYRAGLDLAGIEAAAFGADLSILDEAMGLGRLQGLLGTALDSSLRQATMTGADIGIRFGPAVVQGVSVNSVGELALGFVEERTASRIVGISNQQRAGVRRILQEILTDFETPTEAAHRIGQTVGLTERQVGWVEGFRRRQRALIIPTAEADTLLARSALDRAVETYRDRLIRTRGEAIAQTDIQRALHFGERGLYEVAIDEGAVEREALQRRWLTVLAGVCPVCVPLHGQVRGFDETFQSSGGRGFNGREPPAHINCHCYLEYAIAEVAVAA